MSSTEAYRSGRFDEALLLMLQRIEAAAPADVSSYMLFTGADSVDNIRMYKKAGYRLRGDAPGAPGAVLLTKKR